MARILYFGMLVINQILCVCFGDSCIVFLLFFFVYKQLGFIIKQVVFSCNLNYSLELAETTTMFIAENGLEKVRGDYLQWFWLFKIMDTCTFTFRPRNELLIIFRV